MTMEINNNSTEISEFTLQSGANLKQVRIEYSTIGKKKISKSKEISNAILFCHGWSGSHEQLILAKDIIGPGRAVDTSKYFVVAPTALGSPKSFSPSTSQLGPNFPIYTIEDMVDIQHLLVKDILRINHLKGIIGPSMGGYQALVWAERYPEFMDFIIPIATSYETTGRLAGVYKFMSETIRKDQLYENGMYENQPIEGLKLALSTMYLWYFSPTYYKKYIPDPMSILQDLEKIGFTSIETLDANDILWRNEAMIKYNLKSKLKNIKAHALVIGCNQDQVFPTDTDVLPLHNLLPNSQSFLFDSDFGHMASTMDIGKAAVVIENFISGFNKSSVDQYQ